MVHRLRAFQSGKFVESELGMIPEGWKVGRYDVIIVGTIAGGWGKEKSGGNYLHEVTCIRGCDFQDIKNGLRGNAPTRFILEKNFKNKRFVSNDILVEISGGTQTISTGRVWRHRIFSVTSWLSANSATTDSAALIVMPAHISVVLRSAISPSSAGDERCCRRTARRNG